MGQCLRIQGLSEGISSMEPRPSKPRGHGSALSYFAFEGFLKRCGTLMRAKCRWGGNKQYCFREAIPSHLIGQCNRDENRKGYTLNHRPPSAEASNQAIVLGLAFAGRHIGCQARKDVQREDRSAARQCNSSSSQLTQSFTEGFTTACRQMRNKSHFNEYATPFEKI
jgi:hypothetical protein